MSGSDRTNDPSLKVFTDRNLLLEEGLLWVWLLDRPIRFVLDDNRLVQARAIPCRTHTRNPDTDHRQLMDGRYLFIQAYTLLTRPPLACIVASRSC